jgi:uncharacterized membrane protein YhaH (DUF805 family)
MVAILFSFFIVIGLPLVVVIFLRRRTLLADPKWKDAFSPDGMLERTPYFILGLALFAVKHNLDRLLYTLFYSHPKNYNLPPLVHFFDYVYPLAFFTQDSLTSHDLQYLGLSFLIALPFIYVGVILTLKRLRAVQLPLPLIVLFFAPFVHLLFFFLLSILPSRQEQEHRERISLWNKAFDRLIPDDALGSALMAIVLMVPVGLAGMVLATTFFKSYNWTLFVGGPFVLGLMSTLIYGYHAPRSLAHCIGISLLTTTILCVLFVVLALEGIFCVMMAAPIAGALAAIGAIVGYFIQRRPASKDDIARIIPLLIVFMPGLMGAQYLNPPVPPLLSVVSSVVVDAPASTVWQNVIAFPQLPLPTELMFQKGIAYPTHAIIRGHGVGAVRECHFSTGAFIEPITIWKENEVLQFDVAAQPLPMTEWTPYKNIHPPHLDNYLVSKKGQFVLTSLPDGRTKLEGTTWYTNKMWPQGYWQLWSDYVIHRIHLRVLNHIKTISEQQARISK